MTPETRLRRLLLEKLAPVDREQADQLLSLVISDLEAKLIDMENVKGSQRTATRVDSLPARDENGKP